MFSLGLIVGCSDGNEPGVMASVACGKSVFMCFCSCVLRFLCDLVLCCFYRYQRTQVATTTRYQRTSIGMGGRDGMIGRDGEVDGRDERSGWEVGIGDLQRFYRGPIGDLYKRSI